MPQEIAVDATVNTQAAAATARADFRNAREVPRVKGEPPIIGSTIRFQSDQLGFVTGLQRDYPDVVKARIVHEDWYFVFNPAIVHEANVRQWSKFHKPKIAKTIWKLFLGKGLVPNDGEHWRRQHDLIKPGFHRQRIDAYAPAMVEAAHEKLAQYRDGEIRDVREDINAIALAIVGKTLFGADMSDATSTVYQAMHNVSEMLVEHINLPLPTPRWWPSRGNRRKIDAIEAIEGVIKRLIAERRASGVDGGDLLSHIVFVKDENGVGMTNTELRDEAMTLIFAGHETSAHNMTWCWYLLSKHPEIAERAYAEVREVAGDRPLQLEDLDKLEFLNKCIKESMRLMPAVWTYMRSPIEDVVLDGYFFPKGSTLFISQYALNRDPRWHPDPLTYNPDRWTREYERGLPKGAWVPFAAGPRVCLGQGFAQMEMKLVLGTMLQKLVPTLEPGFEPDQIPELSMHPGPRGMKIKVVFRD
ncbi:MAG: cytochrome P450 [Myxococcales bacterium]|nr:cytochrome P450 [Myxococcales bacterium]